MVFNMRTLSLPKPRTKEDLLVIHGCPLKTFTLRHLKLATDNFSKNNILGRGGYGRVYRGRLADGSLVAIKRLREERTQDGEPQWREDRKQGEELQFQTEVEVGGSPASNHRNVLRLLGYCMTRKERILVYPFIVNRSLASRLWKRDPSESPLDWCTRKRIALGAAKGLAHLHYGSSFSVIHRDIKPDNILLDEQFEPTIGDFGLAKFVGRNGNEAKSGWAQRPTEEHYDDEDLFEEEDESDQENKCFTKSCCNFTRTVMLNAEDGESGSRVHTKWSCWAFTKNEAVYESGHSVLENGGGTEVAHSTYYESCSRVCGTLGYLAPDYYNTLKCSVKADVYSYGVTLLELVTGQRVSDPPMLENGNLVSLVNWVKGLLVDHKLDLLVDSDIRADCILEEVEQLIRLALSCTVDDPKKRPVMKEVIEIIENIGKPPRADLQENVCSDLQENVCSDSLQTFSFQQLKRATDNFSKKNIMGKSGYGYVYKGLVKYGSAKAVVVKRLVKTSRRGGMQFLAEVKLGGIISLKHPNLRQLRGYCISGDERLLVYPFMPNRSLEWRLRAARSVALDWQARKKIAFGVAKGIVHLHYDCDPNVSIGRHISPRNILLDGNFNPVLSNLRLQSNDSFNVDAAVNDVYGYGITLFVLISGKVGISLDDPDNQSGLRDVFEKLRHHQVELLLDPRLSVYDIKDEVDLLIQVALLCTQPSPTDRPEMCQVMQMLQGIGESVQPQVFHELEQGAMMDWPESNTEISISTEFDQTSEVTMSSSSSASSNGKETATFSVKPASSSKLRPQSEGITISDNLQEPKMQERWKTFLSEVVSDALPTYSKLFKSGKSVDPLCPLCNEYEEDNFHLFFKCDFSRQAWLLATGVRMDMMGFGSVKEAVDAILKPNDARFNILPRDVEPSRFSHKGVALMHAIWTHRNQVCFDNVSPNVIQMLRDHPDASNLYGTQPPSAAAQLVNESPTQTQEQFEAGSEAHATGCVRVTSESTNGIQFESGHEVEDTQPQPEQVVLQEVTEPVINNKPHDSQSGHETHPAQLQPEALVVPRVLEPGINNNNAGHDFQLNIVTNSDGFSLSLKFNYLSVWWVIFMISLCMNLVSMWL